MSKDQVKDGLYLFYIKDTEVYPVALTESSWNMLQIMGTTITGDPIQIIDDSMGKVERYPGKDEE